MAGGFGLSDNPEELITINKKNIKMPKVSDVHFCREPIVHTILS